MPENKAESGKPLPPVENRFKPGQSGNPGGRNPERERLRKYIVDSLGQESIDGIAELARGAKSSTVRLDAWIWLAEQAVGKATQPISGEDGGPLKIDIPAIATRLKKLAGEE